MEVKKIFDNIQDFEGKEVVLKGWVRNHRKQKEFGFIDFYDGTTFKTLQIVYNNSLKLFDEIQKIRTGSSIVVKGKIIKSEGGNQTHELQARSIELIGDCPEDYPIQPKRHTREFLREQAYLRPRTALFQAVFRVRSAASFAIHEFFQKQGYVYVHTPIITTSDCEGAGQMFQVTTLDLDKIAQNAKVEAIDYTKDFFNKPASLTVSGQLEAETFAQAFKKVYTFGPTFRAENSNTKTHASEFWMIEPEVAFANLDDIMEVEESMLKYIIKYVLDNCPEEMDFFNKFVEPGIVEKLQSVLDSKSVKIDHKEAIDILLQAKTHQDQKKQAMFEVEPKHGEDLATEHEKYLTSYFNAPVFVKNWPKDIKAFYMRLNDDNETVAAVDLLVPGAGELMGGSQREERYDYLERRMKEMGIPTKGMEWYMNLRKYGGTTSSGFGMGFERLLIYITGVENIRDVIPYPRTPGHCEY